MRSLGCKDDPLVILRKILAAVDASERAPSVLETAVQLAQQLGSTVLVLRAVSVPPEFPAAAAGSGEDPLPAHLAMEAMQQLLVLVAGVARDVEIGPPIVRIGEPWRVILDTAVERDVDLIVLGSHGYRGWDRVLGTTAGKVANLASRNVLVVHSRRHEQQTPPDAAGKIF